MAGRFNLEKLGKQPLPALIGLGAGAAVLAIGAILLSFVGGGDRTASAPPTVPGENDPPPAVAPPPGREAPESQPPSTAANVEPPPKTTVREPRPPAPEESRPDAAPSPDASASPPAGASGFAPGRELGGLSSLYYDQDCREIQDRHGIRIPPGATILEVDGLRLPVESPGALADSVAPYLFLPRGEHVVRFRTSDRPIAVTIGSDLFGHYRAMRSYFDIEGAVKAGELMRRSGQAMDVHGAPFLLNFMGARHAREDHWDAAERHFRRALAVNPAFAPAHLNLAECLRRRNAKDDAIRETLSADAFNVGNVFGLAEPIVQMRRKLGLPLDRSDPVDAAAFSYASVEEISEEDRRLVALMEGISKYAVNAGERGKILNNLAVHFADSGRPELALHHFRKALAVVKQAGTERFAVGRKILANMSQVCRKAGFEEADEYKQMQYLVEP